MQFHHHHQIIIPGTMTYCYRSHFLFFAAFFFLSLFVSSLAQENGDCPRFDYSNCALGVSGMIDYGANRWIKLYTGDSISLTKEKCVNYCDLTPNCTYWTYAEGTRKNQDVCYMYDVTGCDAFVINSIKKLPFIKNPISDLKFSTGQICCTVNKTHVPSVEGDPHFTGGDDSKFDFTGEPGNNYCILSDSHIHINAYYGGRYDRWGRNPRKPLTWIRQIAVLWGHHGILFASREGAGWHYGEGYLRSLEVDGDKVHLSQAGDSRTFFDDRVHLRWLEAKTKRGGFFVDVYEIEIKSVVVLRITLRPEVSLLRTKSDGVVHMNIEMPYVTVSDNVHGVLGQTFRGDRKNRGKKYDSKAKVIPGDNGEGFLDGVVSDYAASDIMRADCAYARFARAEALDVETTRAIESSSGVASDELVTDE